MTAPLNAPAPPRPSAALVVTKYHGAGNDFVVLVDLDDTAPPVGPATARRLCDRHLGIGADGLIRASRASPDRGAILRFELWNADGSPAEMSGNGMRCLAQAALEAGVVEPGVAFGVVTPAGLRKVTAGPADPAIAGGTWAVVEMGRALIEGEPLAGSAGEPGRLLIDVGNPHLVVLGTHPAEIDVATVGRQLGTADPGGRNVEFVAFGPGAEEITMRVWERGVGETLACGTGACAAALAGHHWGRVGTHITVHQPGGSVVVDLRSDGTVTLAGPSQRIATCWTLP